MKYLSNYMEDRQTALLNETGSFFAFSQEQYAEGAKEGVEYAFVGAGLVVPEEHAVYVVDKLEKIYEESIIQDLAENGKEGVIERELANHEAYYTYTISETWAALKDYGFAREEVQAVFNRIAPTYDI